jgi:hypothetical protein
MKTSIFQQHAEHSEWLNKLAFYHDEIDVMQKRLDEVSSKNNGHEVSKEIEHFQNQLFIQSKNLSDIRHHINREEKQIQAAIKSNPVAVDHRKTEDHSEERAMVEGFEGNFNQLRKAYNEFLGKRL